jgi:RNA polymerase sigma factor (sigma-70 family)
MPPLRENFLPPDRQRDEVGRTPRPEPLGPRPKAQLRLVADRKERDRLIEEHLPLVRFLAERFQKRCPVRMELDDLIDSGIQGLVTAAQRFDASKGVQFATFAQHRILGAIRDSQEGFYPRHVACSDLKLLRSLYIPVEHISTKRIEIRQAVSRLKPRHQRLIALYYNEGFTLAEIAKRWAVSERRVSQIRQAAIAALKQILQ